MIAMGTTIHIIIDRDTAEIASLSKDNRASERDSRLKLDHRFGCRNGPDHWHRTIGNLYLSLMQAAGLETEDTFGQLDSNLKGLDLTGPLAELMSS